MKKRNRPPVKRKSAFSPPKKRRTGAAKRLGVVGITLGLSCLLIFGILPNFTVRSVTLSGIDNDKVLKDELQKLVGKNLLFLRSRHLAETLEKRYAYTAAVTVHKQFPQTLGVSVEQRIPLAQLVVIEKHQASHSAEPNTFASEIATASPSATPTPPPITTVKTSYLLDKHAVPFTIRGTVLAATYFQASESAKQKQVHLPYVIYEPDMKIEEGKAITDSYVKQAVALTESLLATPVTVREYKKIQGFSIQATFDGSLRVLFSAKKDAKSQIAALQTVLESSKIDRKRVSTIDVRFDKPAVSSQ